MFGLLEKGSKFMRGKITLFADNITQKQISIMSKAKFSIIRDSTSPEQFIFAALLPFSAFINKSIRIQSLLF